MLRVLVVSAEPRLVSAIQDNLDRDAEVRVVQTADEAQQKLFAEPYGLALIDFKAVRGAPLDTFIALDNVLQKERSTAALLVRSWSAEAEELKERLDSIPAIVDLSQGRDQFDDKIQLLQSKAKDRSSGIADDVSTDGLLRYEVDLPALEEGSLVEFPLARVLYTIRQRKETGVLTLKYAGHSLDFGFVNGELSVDGDFEPPKELLGAFSWSHGAYRFEPAKVSGKTTSVIDIIAEGCREHIRQRGITELMTPVMRRYPVKTNLWAERSGQLEDYEILQQVMELIDGSTNWENALSHLGQDVTDGFRAAYFAIQLDLVYTVEQAGFEGAAVQYSRAVRQARAAVDRAEVEKTKAFQATSNTGRSKLEKELGVRLSTMRDQTIHEIFGVWEGCGRDVVRDRFYVLVKENHPDVYGGNTSGDVRELAQNIFILIKESYQKLLAEEKEQTVPPPDDSSNKANGSSNGAQKAAQTPGRSRRDTPRLDASAGLSDASDGDDDSVDVKSKLSMLSGYRRKQKHRERLRSRQGSSPGGRSPSAAGGDAVKPTPTPTQPEPEPEPEDPKEVAQRERQAKLDKLLKRAQSVANPDGPNPAREFWNKGYHAYKENNHQEAYEHFEKAYELDQTDGAILTFYAYTRFLEVPNTAQEAELLLRKALETGNRQSAPDACLFLGHVLKAQGHMDEALKFYDRALRLNPASREAQREIRLAEKRGQKRKDSDPGNFIKNLFKK